MSDTPLSTTGHKARVVNYLMDFLKEELVAEKDDARRNELQNQLQMFRFLPKRDFTPEDVVVPSALVSLDFGGRVADYLIVPSLGGLVTSFEGRPLQVITPNSPLGEQLMGKKLNESLEVDIGGKTRKYTIVAFH